ncbi:MAG: YidC/Oxa1 family membrane protein insertase [Lachnospiraceae bacterium]|nr:YidC/Oxa1 family membrane protein insertase [Lachnospiraceae bacterium]
MFDFYLTQYGGSILGPIAKILGAILNAIYNFLSNFGIENAAVSIVIFTFIVNLLMLPMTIKQQKFSKMSSVIQPELKAITDKYKGKKDEASVLKQQEETRALYEKYGTSPAGGCLPMLITFLVFMALYRVIYAIPAYVDQIYVIYESVAKLVTENTEALKYLADNATSLGVSTSGWGENLTEAMLENQNYIIDILNKFGSTHWDTFSSFFSGAQATEVVGVADKIKDINGVFGGLNISETPVTKLFPGIIIPILSVILQFMQTRLMPNNANPDPDNPMAQSLKSMNVTMPIISGVFCLFFPIGSGLYLIAGNVFRIIQQFFVNKYMDTLNVDEMVEKNQAKAKAKRERLGLEVSDGSIKNVANNKSVKSLGDLKTDKNKEKDTDNISGKYKKGSIASIAHMMEQVDEKNKGDK